MNPSHAPTLYRRSLVGQRVMEECAGRARRLKCEQATRYKHETWAFDAAGSLAKYERLESVSMPSKEVRA